MYRGRRGSFHVCLKAKMITKINTICVCQSNLFSQRPNVSKNFDIFCFWMHLILIVNGTKTVCTRNILLCPGLYLHWICSLEFLTFYKRNRFQARIDVDNTELLIKNVLFYLISSSPTLFTSVDIYALFRDCICRIRSLSIFALSFGGGISLSLKDLLVGQLFTYLYTSAHVQSISKLVSLTWVTTTKSVILHGV